MEFKELLERSQCMKYDYPDIFQINCGSKIIPAEGYVLKPIIRRNRTKRSAILNLSTFIGSIGAIHYYGSIEIDGYHMTTEDAPYGWVSSKETNDFIKKNPLADSSYILTLTRPITKEEKELDENAICHANVKFPYQDAGELTMRWNGYDGIIDFAKEVFLKRFTGDWNFEIHYEWLNKFEPLSKLK